MAIRVLGVGAHPDDCEGSVGGTAAMWRWRGDAVKFVSVTNGSRGHYLPEYAVDPKPLVDRRMAEARAATEPHGIEFECLGVPDGEVYVTPELTEAMIRTIRRFRPDLVVTNRPCDYHRDHRYTAQLVLDASYMLTVPLMCPDTPILPAMPAIAYWDDNFTEAGAFLADVTIDIAEVIEEKRDMMLAHESQYLEWLPYNDGRTDVPLSREQVRPHLARSTVESFQISEYGTRPHDWRTLFPRP